jgi:hypothetical protein
MFAYYATNYPCGSIKPRRVRAAQVTIGIEQTVAIDPASTAIWRSDHRRGGCSNSVAREEQKMEHRPVTPSIWDY